MQTVDIKQTATTFSVACRCAGERPDFGEIEMSAVNGTETVCDGLIRSRSDAILFFRFDRKEQANAMTVQVMETLTKEISSVGRETLGVVLTGSPGRHFSAGADLRSHDESVDRTRGRGALVDLLLSIIDSKKPLVAAINGAAVGAGAMVALACDYVVASDSAFLSFPEIDLGLPSPLSIAMLSTLSCGALAHEMSLSGRRMSGDEATRYGLVGKVCPMDQLEERALAECLSLGRKPAEAFAANKNFSRRRMRYELEQASEISQILSARTRAAGGTIHG
jgi:enoyl-CoA hydratase/carnithine racemase